MNKQLSGVILFFFLLSHISINLVFANSIDFELDATPIGYGIVEDKKIDYSITDNIEEIKEEQIDNEITIYDLYTEEEIQLLFKCVETETFGADYDSKKNVASVILNRQEQYNKSLKQIITAPNQFCYSKSNISDLTKHACEDALNNRGDVSKALYFRSDKSPETWNGRTLIHTDSVGHNFY